MPTPIRLEKPQVFFHVRDMTSLQSADAVKGAVLRLDERATVRIDLSKQRVEIDPIAAEPSAFRDAIANAGYSSLRQWPLDCAYL